jgi:hypothetical protein
VHCIQRQADLAAVLCQVLHGLQVHRESNEHNTADGRCLTSRVVHNRGCASPVLHVAGPHVSAAKRDDGLAHVLQLHFATIDVQASARMLLSCKLQWTSLLCRASLTRSSSLPVATRRSP